VEAVEHLRRGDVSPLELVETAIERIAATNPAINAIVTPCYDRARSHARRIMNGEAPAGSLGGLPIAVKDNTDVEGVRCTSGSRIHAERIAPGSDAVVRRLEAAGAIVVGKSARRIFRSSRRAATRSTTSSGRRAIPGIRA
jgi:amidase